MIRHIRIVLLAVARWTGLFHLWRYLHRREIIILMIHGVMESDGKEHWTPLWSRLSARHLERYLRVLSRHYRFVSLAEAEAMITGRKTLQNYAVAVTFDDGYRNNLTRALPVLHRLGVPATFFVATGRAGTAHPYWIDRVDYALQHAVARDNRRIAIAGKSMVVRSNDRRELASAYRELRQDVLTLERNDIEITAEWDRLASDLEAACGRRLADVLHDDEWAGILTWEDLRSLPPDLISVGSHTVDHARLGLVDAEMQKQQLVESRKAIERETGRVCDHFAYPNGSFGAMTPAIVRECGYTCAVTALEGTNRMGDDPFTLRRINVPCEGSCTELLAQMSGVSSALRRARGYARRFWSARHRRRADVAEGLGRLEVRA